MIEFASLEEIRIGDGVETLEAIYAETGKPVSARAIGEVLEMQPPLFIKPTTPVWPSRCRSTIPSGRKVGFRHPSTFPIHRSSKARHPLPRGCPNGSRANRSADPRSLEC